MTHGMIDLNNLDPSVRVVYPRKIENHLSPTQIADRITSDPEIRDFIAEPTLLIINDAHRATPSYLVTEPLLSMRGRIDLLAIATGTHSPPSKEEIDELVRGKAKSLKLHIHSAHEPLEEYTYWGRTPRGTEVYISKIIDRYERILCVNSVEPHYFAGYTGGVKSIIPGLAALKTVENNHSWALDEGSAPCATEGNPLYMDFWDAFELIDKQVMGVHLVLRGDEIIGMSIGDLRRSQREAIELADRVYTHIFNKPVDRLVALVEPPLDRSFYQSQKGLENTRGIIRKGGKVLLVAKCHEGIGNKAFFETLRKYGDRESVISNLSREKYRFGDHKARKLAELASTAELFTTAQMGEEEMQTLYLNRENDVMGFINEGVKNGENVVVCFDAGMNVLRLRD